MKKLTIDFETRSRVDLKKFGAARYAEDPSTDVLCLALKWNGLQPVIWYPEWLVSRFPGLGNASGVTGSDIRRMVAEADVIEAHNAQFEYFIWKYVMTRYGFPMLDASRLRCSAAKAAMYGLPRSLEQACRVLGVREQKDMEGSRLMMSLCKPRQALKAEKESDPGWASKTYWRGDEAAFVRLGIYCMQDVRAEEAFSDALPDLPPAEQALWQLDLAINDRGVHVDAPACKAILECLETHSARLIREFSGLTGLNSPRQRDATLKHLIALGVEMDGLTARDVEKALAATENQTAKAILEIRKSLSKSSTAKYTAFLGARCSDDRLRGMLVYHGAGTGRWTGKIIQPQNFPRGEFPDVDGAIELFEAGNLELIDLLYGDPMAAAATCIRGMITPAAGCDFICADYNAIEGRVLAWLAGEESALDVYREGRDPYKVAAQAIYHGVGYDEVSKEQRRIGKVSELACIAEGQEVLTDKGLIPIERVTPAHKVWDGKEWVSHDGVAYKGEREVMEYEGLWATPDHLVWVEGKSRPVPFGHAAARRACLVQAGIGRNQIRVGEGYLPREEMEQAVECLLCSDRVRRLREKRVELPERAYSGSLKRVSELFSAEANPPLAGEEADRRETAMREPEGPRFPKLRRAWNYFRLLLRTRGGFVDSEESSGSGTRVGNRPNRQQPRVRSWKSSICDASGKHRQPPEHHSEKVESLGMAVLPQCRCPKIESGNDAGADYFGCRNSGSEEVQKLAGHRRKARVYDILNAGPRHRFTVSGVLVHNCGYQGGANAFNRMGENYGVTLPEKEAKEIVEKWRSNRPETVRLWAELEKMCLAAVSNPGKVYKYRAVKMTVRGRFLAVKLPSGRCLYYASPRVEEKEMSWGGTKPVVSYEGVNSYTRKWERLYLYGGLLTENVTQATARDILAEALPRVEKAGYPVVMHVHDEAVSEVREDFGSVREFEALLCVNPEWAPDLPLKAEGWRGKRYKK